MIDLRSLRYVVTLARHRSFARAAADIGISQPALTRAVQILERQFGVRLFDRDRAGVTLTAHGQAMIDAASVLLANAEELERQWHSAATGDAGVLRFGMAPMPARALLPAALRDRLLAASSVRNNIVVRNVEALWPLLVAGDIEFFVAAEGQVPDAPPVRAETLGKFPVSHIVRSGHPLLRNERTDQKFPIVASSHSGRSLPSDLQRHADGPPHVVEDFEVLAKTTACTDAIWQSSTFAVADEIDSGILSELPRTAQDAPRELRIVVYALERRTLSPAARALISVCRQRISELARSPAGAAQSIGPSGR